MSGTGTLAPSDLLLPGDETDLAALVADAAGRRAPLAVEGGGTRHGLGRPVQASASVSTRAMRGITLYEPSEMIIAARAGTPLAEVEAALAGHGQRLPFEPMDHRPLYGSAGEPTIGAVAAANISGPRRVQAGAARDHLIGIRAVNGRGEAIKSGGRVMKNVTGYDLVKALAGSYGTLAILSEVTFKVLPISETEVTLVLEGLADADAVAALLAALGSPFDVSAAAHRPADGRQPARSFVRIDGFAASVAYRADRLADLLGQYGPSARLEAAASADIWRGIRDVADLGAGTEPLWRISAHATDAAAIVAAIGQAFPVRVLYDWGGALVWLAGGEGPDAGAATIRAALPAGATATLVRAPEPVRVAAAPLPLPSPGVMELTRRLKESFDPAGILNPGRMYAGI